MIIKNMQTIQIMALMCLILLLMGHDIDGTMTESQLKSAVKLVRNVCQPKTKAKNEDIDKMHNGDWNIDHTAMCYMACALNMYKLINKDNTFAYDMGIKLVHDTVPEARKALTKATLDDCKSSAKTINDRCTAAYEISKCLYESNPSNYFLP